MKSAPPVLTRFLSESRARRSRDFRKGNQIMGPLLYRPPPRWQAFTAIAGALAVHGAAVAIAAIHLKEPPPQDLENIPEAVELSLDTAPEPPAPTPPPEEEPPPPPPP